MRLTYENDTTLYNTKKMQTRTKRDKLKNTITPFLERNYYLLERKNYYSYLPISVTKFIFFIYVWPLRPLITQYLAYDNKN